MTNSPSGSFRPKRVNFAQISNTALQDTNLSLKAKGLYSIIQSLITLPGEDNLRIWKIKKMCKEGDKSFDSTWKELKEAGYLKQYRIPCGEKGKFKYEYDLLDQPDLSTSTTINLDKYGQPIPHANSDQEDTNHTPQKGVGGQSADAGVGDDDSDHYPQNGGYGQEAEIEADHTPHLAPSGESTPCLKHPVLNGGGNDNTVFDNTISDNIKSISQSYKDGLTDFLREKLKVQIEYDYFEDNRPEDLPTVNSILDYLVEMQAARSTKINGVTQSSEALSVYIDHIDCLTISEFMEHMRGKKLKDVKNLAAYWRSCLINFLREREAQKMTV